MSAAATSASSIVVPAPEGPIVEAFDEPRHKVVFENEYVRLIRVQFPARDVTLFHRHQLDSFYIHLKTAELRNDVVGKPSSILNLKLGGCAYGAHGNEPFVHQITGLDDVGWDCIDGELLAPPPSRSQAKLDHDAYDVILESPRVRMYSVTIEPGTTVGPIAIDFYAATTVLQGGSLALDGAAAADLELGHIFWEEPNVERTYENTGAAAVKLYVTEIL